MKATVTWKSDTPKDSLLRVKQIEEIVRNKAHEVAEYVRKRAVERSPIDTGELITSWGAVKETSGGFSFSSGVDYAVILERGLYTKVGPKTVKYEGGIYSSQAPGGMISPTVNDPKFTQQIVEEILKKISEILSGVS